ncbi:hypothetical protein EV182_001197, partial [Spiromyces aspiralis]
MSAEEYIIKCLYEKNISELRRIRSYGEDMKAHMWKCFNKICDQYRVKNKHQYWDEIIGETG